MIAGLVIGWVLGMVSAFGLILFGLVYLRHGSEFPFPL